MSALESYLQLMVDKSATDLLFSTGAPPSLKVEGEMVAVHKNRLEPGVVAKLAHGLMSVEQRRDFERELECNLGLSQPDIGRFRINVFKQKGEVSMVIRFIKAKIPTVKELHLPSVLEKLILVKKGLLLVVGSSGAGKSTTLASMLDHRNIHHAGHILTIEDPIEYCFEHKKSIVDQREVGLDTHSYRSALREVVRESPDVVVIGEVRDRDTMEAAITYADTGHLCVSTLHAVNAYQAMDRIINLFPHEMRDQILMDLSLNLNAIISQRLLPSKSGKRVPAMEVMIVTPYISELIRKGEFHKVKEAMAKGGGHESMLTFDQSLYALFKSGKVELHTALDYADSRSDLEWKINFGGGIGELHRDTEAEELTMPGTTPSSLRRS
ncbi:MAG: PilT/PilU family type 4a pilus ATPase [Gammaproteobacteria bacterium]|nr:PilT/PilU family type 4a pilus ATPase [Gammaproteobacteria bacterium]